ncbi:hypothetical protein [Aureliella helgolandensis]|uniref:Transposase IS200 like protein n=1 Tax=Aureliella helgolandensis TaxID=2527968 RepID=A0A518GCV2_9BACT|nr:hypothetical protein [Aureliella helgolandensis]QDV26403.1 hypothetical protein Q31a_47770 [Aureliella helgolandensis]
MRSAEVVVAEQSKPEIGAYGQYLNSLHIVMENADGLHEVREDELQAVRDIVIRATAKKNWWLSRIGLLSNHLHVLLGARVTDSPQAVALSLMNNIAYVYEMKAILKFSYYAGTFAGYDRGAIRLHATQVAGPAGTSPDGGPHANAV